MLNCFSLNYWFEWFRSAVAVNRMDRTRTDVSVLVLLVLVVLTWHLASTQFYYFLFCVIVWTISSEHLVLFCFSFLHYYFLFGFVRQIQLALSAFGWYSASYRIVTRKEVLADFISWEFWHCYLAQLILALENEHKGTTGLHWAFWSCNKKIWGHWVIFTGLVEYFEFPSVLWHCCWETAMASTL